MLPAMLRRRQYAARYREITTTLIAHGLGGLVAPLGLSLRARATGSPVDVTTRPEHVRLAFEQLGPTFIKLGQILSTRSDLLPPAYVAELVKLQDQVPPVGFEQIREVIESSLGASIEERFAWFDPEALAAASIGQVHPARLPDGRDVVVKVQRPGVRNIIEQDLAILRDLATVADERIELARQLDLVGLVREFAWTLREELDYLREGRNAERFGRAFAKNPDIVIPEIHWSHSSDRVLTMERISGLRIDDLAGLEAAGHDRVALARKAADVMLTEVFEHGFFHADPHPGNFAVMADGHLGVMDFGMVGAISEQLQEQLLFLTIAVVDQDTRRIANELMTLGAARAEIDRQTLERDLDHLIAQYVGRPLREIKIESVLTDVTAVIRRNRLRLPSELTLLAKTLVMSEALGRQLDPGFDAIQVAEPYARRAARRFYSVDYWRKRLRSRPLETALLASTLPGQTQRLLSRIERDDLAIHVRYDELDEVMRGLGRIANRLVIAILAAAMAIALALVYAATDGVLRQAVAVVFGFGLVATIVVVLAIVVTLWRGGRR